MPGGEEFKRCGRFLNQHMVPARSEQTVRDCLAIIMQHRSDDDDVLLIDWPWQSFATSSLHKKLL